MAVLPLRDLATGRKSQTRISILARRSVWIWIMLGCMAVCFAVLHQHFAQDDAYITYRYARNLSRGVGFVYNPGEQVLGTTTPLFTLMLAALTRLTGVEVSSLSLIVGAVSLWVSAGMLYQYGRAQNMKLAPAIAVIYLANPFMPHIVGMESFFLLGMLLLTTYAYTSRRWFWAAALGGLLVLVRYEMLFLVVLMGADYILSQRKLPLWLWPSAIPGLLWGLAALRLFGSPIPQSVSAKLAAPRIPFLVGAAGYWYSFNLEVPLLALAGILLLGGVCGLIMTWKVNRHYRLLVLFSLVYLGAATWLAGSFPWYYAPLMPLYAIAIGYGIHFLGHALTLLGKKGTISKAVARAVQMASLALVLIAQLMFWQKAFRFPEQAFDGRYAAYQSVSKWILAHASPTQTIAAFEIGYIGYFTDLKIIDFSALVTPGLMPWAAEESAAAVYHGLRLYAPDWVVISAASQSQREVIEADPHYLLQKNFDDRYLLYSKIAPPPASSNVYRN